MDTSDTEGEKLKKEFIEELKLGKRGHFFRENPDGSVYILAYAGEFIDKLFSSRDTYWKERVRKDVERMKITSDPQSVQVNAHIATWEQGYNHAISEVLELDNLK